MIRFLCVCLGGAFGTALRYLMSLWAPRVLGQSFPYATLLVNLSGCFLISVIMHLGLSTSLLSPTARLTLTTGVMGGLTTYSSFNYETLRYFQEGAWVMGLVNITATFFGCMLAGILGLLFIQRALGR